MYRRKHDDCDSKYVASSQQLHNNHEITERRYSRVRVSHDLEIEVYSPLMLYHVPRATDFENNEVGA